jgi:transposase InsO family protein
MGRVGACADNAAIESFFSLLQKNVLNRRRWTSREQLRLAIITWIERTYHRRRRQDRLRGSTPIEFETLPQAAHATWPTPPRRVNESLGRPLRTV